MKIVIVDDQTLIRDGLVTICERFDDVAELKAHVLANPDQLARNLAVKFLTYATGRQPSPGELVEVDEIVTRLRESLPH